MKAYGEPILEHFAVHDPKAAGYSLVQLIETSAITGHFVDKTGEAFLDIFSCKSFDHPKAVIFIQDELEPAALEYQVIFRKSP